MLEADAIRQHTLELGFNLVGLTRAEPSPQLAAYHRWIERGMHGAMGYMARPDRIVRRENLQEILPGAQSMIIVGLDYHTQPVPEKTLNDPSRGRIAAYARGLDYHDIMQKMLESLVEWIQAQMQQRSGEKVYVDTGAILERSHARQAGMGFTGKNTMLIHPRRGSNFFIGEIITTLELSEYDTPHQPTMCGTCTRCLTACPTDAFPEPYVLDARRCISYHTIENKGSIPLALRPSFGNWIFGCDICQDVCPWQRFTIPTNIPQFQPPDMWHIAPSLDEALMLDETTFKQIYAGTPIHRIKRRRFVRNACVAAGNSQDTRLIPYLIQLLYDHEPLVRSHAAWALHRLMGDAAEKQLSMMYHREDDEDVRRELEIFAGD